MWRVNKSIEGFILFGLRLFEKLAVTFLINLPSHLLQIKEKMPKRKEPSSSVVGLGRIAKL